MRDSVRIRDAGPPFVVDSQQGKEPAADKVAGFYVHVDNLGVVDRNVKNVELTLAEVVGAFFGAWPRDT